MSENLFHVTTVTRDLDSPIDEVWAIVGAFGSERLWIPHVKKVSLQGFGIGSVRTVPMEPPGRPLSTTDDELILVDVERHTIRYRVRRSDLADAAAFGTCMLEPLGASRTRFHWTAEVDITDESLRNLIKEELEGLYNESIIAIERHLE